MKIGFLHPTERAMFYTDHSTGSSRTMYIGYSIENRKYGKLGLFSRTTYVLSLNDLYWADPGKKQATAEEIAIAIKRIGSFLQKELDFCGFCFE